MAFLPKSIKLVVRGDSATVSAQGAAARGTKFTIRRKAIRLADLKTRKGVDEIQKLLGRPSKA